MIQYRYLLNIKFLKMSSFVLNLRAFLAKRTRFNSPSTFRKLLPVYFSHLEIASEKKKNRHLKIKPLCRCVKTDILKY